ncbi:hypothetical protein [Mailhella sp.]|uniref:hypothetical protein n=1 Tax=Mailhella sp. TaxID=1981029 RepID=UPI003AB65A95
MKGSRVVSEEKARKETERVSDGEEGVAASSIVKGGERLSKNFAENGSRGESDKKILQKNHFLTVF